MMCFRFCKQFSDNLTLAIWHITVKRTGRFYLIRRKFDKYKKLSPLFRKLTNNQDYKNPRIRFKHENGFFLLFESINPDLIDNWV
jgi:hypothetical protein